MNESGAGGEDECRKPVGLAWAVPKKFKRLLSCRVSAPQPLLDTTYLNWGGYATNVDSALFFEAVLTKTGGSRGYARNFGSALFFGAVVRTTGGSQSITVV